MVCFARTFVEITTSLSFFAPKCYTKDNEKNNEAAAISQNASALDP
jgi:hypothetical protein